MADQKKLFAIGFQIHQSLGVDVGSICWGSCGKGLVGGIMMDDWGDALPCDTPAAECPHFEKETSEPFATVSIGGEPERPIYLRKLRATPKAAP